MDTKTYDTITVKKEKDGVVISNPETHIAMKRSTWRAIVADNVKEVMRGNNDNVTESVNSITGEV